MSDERYEFVGSPFTRANVGRASSLWQRAARHRQHQTRILTEAAAKVQNPTLTILGAGNCNSIDLPKLRSHFSKIHLVGWDAAAMERGAREQGLQDCGELLIHGGIDLLNASRPSPENPAKQPARQSPFLEIEAADVVASTGILSQMIGQELQMAKSNRDDPEQQISEIRQRHFELIISKTRVSGTGLLIDLITSSEIVSGIADPNRDLNRLVLDAAKTQQHFSGMNPFAIHHQLANSPSIRDTIDEIKISKPWVWDATDSLLVCMAFQFTRIR